MHARYYSFHTARFLSVDPVKGEVGSSQSWNRYAYVLGNPIRLSDPSGAVVVLDIESDEDRRDLLAQWERQAGLDLKYDDGEVTIAAVKTDADGNALGSAYARKLLTKRVNSTETYTVHGVSFDPNITFGKGQQDGYDCTVDFGDFDVTTYESVPEGAQNASMTTFHEFMHQEGFDDPPDPENGGTVRETNRIRGELGLPLRDQYGPRQDGSGREYISFGNGTGRVYMPLPVFVGEITARRP